MCDRVTDPKARSQRPSRVLRQNLSGLHIVRAANPGAHFAVWLSAGFTGSAELIYRSDAAFI
jgi:hypothetical protein